MNWPRLNTRLATRRRRSWRPNLEEVEGRQLLSAISVEYAATAHETDLFGRVVQQILGAPTSGEINVPGVPDALMETFQGGTIYWSPTTGAHVVYGGIGAEYKALAHETDLFGRNVQLVLGLPTSDEMDVPGVSGARMNTFQGGAIYGSLATGAHVVYGGIGAKYNSLGGPASFLGLPISDEQGIPGGRVSYFQHGEILGTPQGGVYVEGPAHLAPVEQAIVDLTNQERQSAGLPPLAVNAQLVLAAQIHADNMARLDQLSHELPSTSLPTPEDRLSFVGYSYSWWGENIGYNYRDASDAVRGWMDSPGHRANILSPNYTEIGVGVALNSRGQPYYCVVFGRPR